MHHHHPADFSSFIDILFFWLLFFKTGFLYVALEPVLELALEDEAGLKLRDPPASASQVLGLKLCVTQPSSPKCLSYHKGNDDAVRKESSLEPDSLKFNLAVWLQVTLAPSLDFTHFLLE